MTDRLPKYDSPPIVETVLSVQFAPLQNYSSAHGGWFWKGYLGKEWSRVQNAPRLDDQFERFGDEMIWGRGGGFRIVTQPEPERLQIIRADNERMIQVQDTRLIFNWKKQEAVYPSYDKLLPEFHEVFSAFKKFAADNANSTIQTNQWEVTYVNFIPKGELWQTVDDWQQIIPALSMLTNTRNLSAEDFRSERRFIIGDNVGRLHMSLMRGKLGTEKGEEVLHLQFTARGPVMSEDASGLDKGFELGHESIVLLFTDMTSDFAHRFWKRRA